MLNTLPIFSDDLEYVCSIKVNDQFKDYLMNSPLLVTVQDVSFYINYRTLRDAHLHQTKVLIIQSAEVIADIKQNGDSVYLNQIQVALRRVCSQ